MQACLSVMFILHMSSFRSFDGNPYFFSEHDSASAEESVNESSSESESAEEPVSNFIVLQW